MRPYTDLNCLEQGQFQLREGRNSRNWKNSRILNREATLSLVEGVAVSRHETWHREELTHVQQTFGPRREFSGQLLQAQVVKLGRVLDWAKIVADGSEATGSRPAWFVLQGRMVQVYGLCRQFWVRARAARSSWVVSCLLFELENSGLDSGTM